MARPLMRSEVNDMKKYNNPNADIIYLGTQDIMIVSGDIKPQDKTDPFVYSPWGFEDIF